MSRKKGSTMMTDSSHQNISEWLQLLGCPVQLTGEDLCNLNMPMMRPVWRHLQRHVKPVQTIKTIKKNLLLAKLKENNILPGAFGNLEVESVCEFTQLEARSKTQSKIASLKNHLSKLDQTLTSSVSTLLCRQAQNHRYISSLREIEDKSFILKLKLSSIKNDTEMVQKEIDDFLNIQTFCSNSIPSTNFKSKRLELSASIMKLAGAYVLQNNEELFLDSVNNIIIDHLDFSADLLLAGVLTGLNNALTSLKKSAGSLVMSQHDSAYRKKSSEHLKELNAMVIKNSKEVNCILSIVHKYESYLHRDKIELAELMESNYQGSECTRVSAEFVDKVVGDMILKEQMGKLKEMLVETENNCSEFNDFKQNVDELGVVSSGLKNKTDKSVDAVNKLIVKICKKDIKSLKLGVLKECTELKTAFCAEMAPKEDTIHTFLTSTEKLIEKEIETFDKVPLVAISRKWEGSLEYFPHDILQDVSKHLPLLRLIFQTEPKDLLKNVLEKFIWYYTLLNCTENDDC